MRYMLRCLLFLLLVSHAGALGAQNIWFSPNKADFLNEASKNANWNSAAQNLAVFKYYCDAILRTEPAAIKRHLASLSRLGVRVGVECALLTMPGYSGEGFTSFNKAILAIDKLAALGGEISFLVMDEPLYYAHYENTGKRYIGWSVGDICKNLSLSLQDIVRRHPNIIIGDIEPVQRIKPGDLRNFFECYRQVMGRDLDFFHSDVAWHEADAISVSQAIGDLVVGRGIRYGVIFNSSDYNAGNDAWIDSARRNFDRYFDAGGHASDVIFQSWNREPRNITGARAGKYHAYLIKYACERLRCSKASL